MHLVHTISGSSWVFVGEEHTTFHGEGTPAALSITEELDGFPEVWIEANNMGEVLLAKNDPGNGPLSRYKRAIIRRTNMKNKVELVDIRCDGVFRALSSFITPEVYIGIRLIEMQVDRSDQINAYQRLRRQCKLQEKAFLTNVHGAEDMRALLRAFIDPDVPLPDWLGQWRNDGNPLHDKVRRLDPNMRSVLFRVADEYWDSLVSRGDFTKMMASMRATRRTEESRLVLSRYDRTLRTYFVHMWKIILDLYVCCRIWAAPPLAEPRCLLLGENHVRGVLDILDRAGTLDRSRSRTIPQTDAGVFDTGTQLQIQILPVPKDPSMLLQGFHEARRARRRGYGSLATMQVQADLRKEPTDEAEQP